MALAFVNRQPFLTSNIIGASSMEQLKTDLTSVDVELSEEVLTGIEEIHKLYTYPCP
jgi:aryl-alcohol dehydrogenase-like predicted oxidoreductase